MAGDEATRCGECGGALVEHRCVDCGTRHGPAPRWLHPEVMLLGDHTMSRVRWTLDNETHRIETFAAENEAVAKLLADNGWTARMLAWGHIIDGLMDAAGFDDEGGRT